MPPNTNQQPTRSVNATGAVGIALVDPIPFVPGRPVRAGRPHAGAALGRRGRRRERRPADVRPAQTRPGRARLEQRPPQPPDAHDRRAEARARHPRARRRPAPHHPVRGQRHHGGAHGVILRTAEPSQLLDAIRQVHTDRRYVDPTLTPTIAAPRARTTSAQHPISAPQPLSRREYQVLQLIADGLENQAIAKLLFLSVETVRTHVKSILRKLPRATAHTPSPSRSAPASSPRGRRPRRGPRRAFARGTPRSAASDRRSTDAQLNPTPWWNALPRLLVR